MWNLHSGCVPVYSEHFLICRLPRFLTSCTRVRSHAQRLILHLLDHEFVQSSFSWSQKIGSNPRSILDLVLQYLGTTVGHWWLPRQRGQQFIAFMPPDGRPSAVVAERLRRGPWIYLWYIDDGLGEGRSTRWGSSRPDPPARQAT